MTFKVGDKVKRIALSPCPEMIQRNVYVVSKLKLQHIEVEGIPKTYWFNEYFVLAKGEQLEFYF